MSEVKMVKRFLVGTSVSVLAGMLMSSAVLAEDDATGVGSVDELGIETQVDPIPSDLTKEITITGDEGELDCADCSFELPDFAIDQIEVEGEVVGEEPVDLEVDTGVPTDVAIDPIELDGEVVDVAVETKPYDGPVSGTPDVQRDFGTDADKPAAVGGRGEGTVARAGSTGQTPGWLQNLFKVK